MKFLGNFWQKIETDLVPVVLSRVVDFLSIVAVFILAKGLFLVVELSVTSGLMTDVLFLIAGVSSTSVFDITLNLWLIITVIVSMIDAFKDLRRGNHGRR